MKYVAFIFLAVITVFASLPNAQGEDPPGWVDLRVDSITFDFPAMDSIRITGYWSVFNNILWDTVIVSDIGIDLDGVVKWGEPIDVTKSMNNCYVFKSPAECSGECYLNTIPPMEIGECTWFYTDPQDTILEVCACWKEFDKSWTIGYAGEEMATFTLDPGGIVVEPWEWNNSISIHVGSVATKPQTWGEIKDTYSGEK